MKRCRECYKTYDDGEKFCEADGHELLTDPTFSPEPEVVATNSPARPVWWPAATLGVVVGVVFGAGVFAAALLLSNPQRNDSSNTSPATEVRENIQPHRVATASISVPTPEPEASPSPDSEEQAAAEPSPAVNSENRNASVQLNQGPISTGEKSKSAEGESASQTVIEMTDGTTLNVDAAWEDKQGIWYRRSGLVSFVDSSRVKTIATREAKVADNPHR